MQNSHQAKPLPVGLYTQSSEPDGHIVQVSKQNENGDPHQPRNIMVIYV